MLSDIITAILESDAQNLGALIVAGIVGLVGYLYGIKIEKSKSPLEVKLEELQTVNYLSKPEHLYLQKLQLVHQAISDLESQQQDLSTSLAVVLELIRSINRKMNSISKTIAILKESEEEDV